MRIRFLSALLPWAYVPLLWALCFSWNLTSRLALTLTTAFLPIAIALGRRYGWRGVATIAAGGMWLPFAISFNGPPVGSNSNLDLYVVSLGAGALAAGLFPLQRWLEILRTRPVAWLIILLLPLQLSLGSAPLTSAATIWFQFDLYLLFWVAIVLAGMSGVEAAVLLLPAAAILVGAAGSMGHFLPWHLPAPMPVVKPEVVDPEVIVLAPFGGSGRPVYPNLFVGYILTSAASLVSLLGYFYFGRWLVRATSARTILPATWKARTLIVSLLIFGAGWLPYFFLLRGVFDGLPAWPRFLTGDYAAIVLAAVLGGLLLGRSGIIWVAVVGAIPRFIEHAREIDDPLSLLAVLWEPVLIAVAFGLCGIQLRRTLKLRPPAIGSLHFKHMALIGFAAVSLIPEEKWQEWKESRDVSFSEVWAVVTIALVMVGIGLRIWWRRRARKNPSLKSEYEGWIALAALIAVAVAAGEHIGEIKSKAESLPLIPVALGELRNFQVSEESSEVLLIVAAGLAILWIFLTTAKEAVEGLLEGWRDGRRALGKLVAFFGAKRLANRLAPPGPLDAPPAIPEDESGESKPKPHWVFRTWAYVNWTVLGLAIALAAVPLFSLAFD